MTMTIIDKLVHSIISLKKRRKNIFVCMFLLLLVEYEKRIKIVLARASIDGLSITN